MAGGVNFLPTFQAEWTPVNKPYAPPLQTLKDKIFRFVWNLFSCVIFPIAIARTIGSIIGAISKKVILPSAWFYPHQFLRRIQHAFSLFCFGPVQDYNRPLREHYEIQRHQVFTPDGAKLNAYHFKHKRADPNADTLLFFQSNASFTEQGVYSWLIDEAIRRQTVCNFVVIDYRGVGNSKGDANQINPLILDGDSAFQFVNKKLNVPAEKIRIYGWSLGGLISSKIKAMHPECTARYVNERSLSKVSEVASQTLPKFLRPLFFWLPFTLRKQGWDLEAPLSDVKGEMMIVAHPGDPTIPYSASAHAAARKANLVFQSLILTQSPEQIREGEDRVVDHHFEPLNNYMAAPEKTADQTIADFILPPPAAAVQQVV